MSKHSVAINETFATAIAIGNPIKFTELVAIAYTEGEIINWRI